MTATTDTSRRALLSGLVDYAGLFPPAGLPLEQAVLNYRRYLGCEHRWMLGRFLCPASRLGELGRHLGPEDAWRVSAVLDLDPAALPERLEDFGRAVEAVEVRAESPRHLEELADRLPRGLKACFEIPVTEPGPYLEVLAGRRQAAKIRTGGLLPEAFPAAPDLARFLLAAARASVAFKATAGLHHALPGSYALTPEPASPRVPMQGFLNLFLSACLAWRGDAGQDQLQELLEEREPPGILRREELLETGVVLRAREQFALGFGSCSFEEPVEELQNLGWLQGGPP